MVLPRVTHTVMPSATSPAPYCISPYPVASAPVITTTSRPTAFLRYASISRRLWRESLEEDTSAATVAMLFTAPGLLLYFSMARMRDLPQLSGWFFSFSSRSAIFFAGRPSSMEYMLSWKLLSMSWSMESSVSSIVSLTASASVLTACAGRPMPMFPCQPKCFTMEVSAFATVLSSASSRGMVITSSMSSPVRVSTGAARSARADTLLRRWSYTPRMLRRSEREPLDGGGGCLAASSNPPAEVDTGFFATSGVPFAVSFALASASAAAAFSAASLARRSTAAASAASASSSTGGGFSRHSPSRSVQLPSPFSSMLMRPSASRPSAAAPMD